MKEIKFALFLMVISTSIVAFASDVETTKNFIGKASMSNKFEIETSQLALQKSQDSAVREFAEQMITDHTKASQELKNTAIALNLDSDIATKFDKEHQDKFDNLSKLNGKDFNDVYIKLQKEGHMKAVDMFSNYASAGDNEAVREFAAKTLPTLKAHKQHVLGLGELE